MPGAFIIGNDMDSSTELAFMLYIDGLVQDCSNSIANALELLQSCTKPSIWWNLALDPSRYGGILLLTHPDMVESCSWPIPIWWNLALDPSRYGGILLLTHPDMMESCSWPIPIWWNLALDPSRVGAQVFQTKVKITWLLMLCLLSCHKQVFIFHGEGFQIYLCIVNWLQMQIIFYA